MKAIDFLKRKQVGAKIDGTPIYTRRSVRWFLIALLAGGRPIVLNTKVHGTLCVDGADGGLIANNSIRAFTVPRHERA